MVKEFQDKQVLIWYNNGEQHVVVDEDDTNFYTYDKHLNFKFFNLEMLGKGSWWLTFEKLSLENKNHVVEAFEAYESLGGFIVNK